MRYGLIIFLISSFLIYDTYYDGKYTKYISEKKKYFKIFTYGFVGISLYMFIKKHPNESSGMLKHAHNIIKYMPVDKNTADLITPIFDFTSMRENVSNQYGGYVPPQTKRMMNSGKVSTNRSVSETKKKYVASQQGWKCAYCSTILDATFEVDHKIELQHGGSNHVDNLAAVCRNCHGKKTMMNKLQ